MMVLPIQALAGLQLLQAAGSLPALIRSADFAGLLRSTLDGAPDRSPKSPPSAANGTGLPVHFAAASPLAAGSLDVAALRSQTETLMETFRTQLNQVLGENGLDTFSGLHLQLNAAGRIGIAGSHPQKESIEAVINAHPELADIFRAIAANLQSLRAMETSPDHPGGDQRSTVDLYVDTQAVEASFVPAGESGYL